MLTYDFNKRVTTNYNLLGIKCKKVKLKEGVTPKNQMDIDYKVAIRRPSDNAIVKLMIKGNKTIIQLYKEGAEKPYVNAVAKCHPDDEFNVKGGITLAVKRMRDKEKAYLAKQEKKNKHWIVDKRTNERYQTGEVVWCSFKSGQFVTLEYNGQIFHDFIKDGKRTLVYNIPLGRTTLIKYCAYEAEEFPEISAIVGLE